MNVEKIIDDCKNRKFAPFYFLQGDEPFFIDQIVEAIDKFAMDEAEKSFNFTVLYGRDTDMDTILNAARRFPMMAERQVVMVKEAQYLSDLNKEQGQQKLIQYLEKVVPSTVLVFCYPGKSLDGRKAFSKTISKKGLLFTGKKIYENEVPAWIDTFLKKKGIGIDPKAKALLTEYIGNNLERLSNELNKIFLNHNDKGFIITDKEIETYVGINKDYNIFEFQNALLSKDRKKLIQILKYFESNEKNNPPIASVAVTYSTLSKLLLTYEIKKPDRNSVASALRMSPFIAQNYLKARMNYSLGHVVWGIDLLAQADAKLKGMGDGSLSKSAIFEEFALKFVQ